jgi:mono/diheme cytochrome c family protein
MKRSLNILFPLVMVMGLIVSVFVIVASLQAAAIPAPETTVAMTTTKADSAELAAHGRDLFIAKGCLVCHRNNNVMAEGNLEFNPSDVPDLTTVRLNEEYLRKWLQDPHAVKPNTEMPNLELSPGEIDALVAFLLTPPQK